MDRIRQETILERIEEIESWSIPRCYLLRRIDIMNNIALIKHLVKKQYNSYKTEIENLNKRIKELEDIINEK